MSSKFPKKGQSLGDICPELIPEWHSSNEGTPFDFKPRSNKKKIWACSLGHKWEAIINNRHKGSGCPACSGRVATPQKNFFTVHPDLSQEWHPKNPKPPESYPFASNDSVWWKCKRGHEWKAVINNRHNGRGCPACSGRIATLERNFSLARPELIAEWHPKNPKPPESYAPNSRDYVWWKCKEGHEWEAPVYRRRAGSGCAACLGCVSSAEYNFALVYPDLVKEWHPKNPKPPESYTPYSDERVWWKCARGHEWEVGICTRSGGSRCSKCSGRLASEERNFAVVHPDLVTEWHSNNLTPPELYAPASGKKVWWKCKKGHEWEAMIYSRRIGNGCPKCHPKFSKAQKEIADFLGGELDVVGLLRGKTEIDVYLPEHKFAVEYCGTYYHSEKFKNSHACHVQKLRDAEKAGLRLITVFENEWVERKGVVLAYLSSILGRFKHMVGARKTVLDTSPNFVEVGEFLEENHIQGEGVHCPVNIVLRQNGNIIAALCCRKAKARGSLKAPRWELIRYCVKSGYQITGGFNRLWHAFVKQCEPETVVTFSDRRWSQGGLYVRAGFVKEQTLSPSYWYVKKSKPEHLYHKSTFTKKNIAKKLGPLLEGETESAAMRRFGYLRIWDCGLDRWLWTNPNQSVSVDIACARRVENPPVFQAGETVQLGPGALEAVA